MAQWKQLETEGWIIDWEAGGGAQTIRNGREKIIQIDGSYGTAQTSQWLAHEMGHAIYQPEPIDKSSYQTCLDSYLIGEGQATPSTTS